MHQPRRAVSLAMAAICSLAAAHDEPPAVAAYAALPEVEGDISRTLAAEKLIRRILRTDENDLIAASPLQQADRSEAS